MSTVIRRTLIQKNAVQKINNIRGYATTNPTTQSQRTYKIGLLNLEWDRIENSDYRNRRL
uniref:Uncharacterized protein n=1 Tax=Romanomermis culicivorax TaxID=13658 RepID=A0A915IBQ4_ROMCU